MTVIAHPKTASKSLASVLIERGWQRVGHHHEMGRPTGSVISVIREPKDWFVSWYFHCGKPRPFTEWLREFIVNETSVEGFYGVPFTTHLIFFDRLQIGLDAVFQDLGQPGIELPHMNHMGRDKQPASDFFDEYSTKLLDRRMVDRYTSLEEKLGGSPYLRL